MFICKPMQAPPRQAEKRSNDSTLACIYIYIHVSICTYTQLTQHACMYVYICMNIYIYYVYITHNAVLSSSYFAIHQRNDSGESCYFFQGSGSRATWTRWNRTNPEDGFPESSWAETWILTTKKTWKKPVQDAAPVNLSIHSISVLKSRHVL